MSKSAYSLVAALVFASPIVIAEGTAHATVIQTPGGAFDFSPGDQAMHDTHFVSASSWLNVGVREASQARWVDLIQWYVDNGNEQYWTMTYVGSDNTRSRDIYMIRNHNSGMCISTDGVAGNPLVQDYCDISNHQEWWEKIPPANVPTGGSVAYGFSSAFSGLCMDVYGDSHGAGAEIDSWYCNGNLNQQFFLDSQGQF